MTIRLHQTRLLMMCQKSVLFIDIFIEKHPHLLY
jgi:hypothetical protein